MGRPWHQELDCCGRVLWERRDGCPSWLYRLCEGTPLFPFCVRWVLDDPPTPVLERSRRALLRLRRAARRRYARLRRYLERSPW